MASVDDVPYVSPRLLTLLKINKDKTDAYLLPDLGYAYTALHPHINEETMRRHHSELQASYVTSANTALKDWRKSKEATELACKPLEQIVQRIHDVPERIRPMISSNCSGFINHAFYWQNMSPPADSTSEREPWGDLGDMIRNTWGSYQMFKTKFEEQSRRWPVLSGWVWLVQVPRTGELRIERTDHEINPMSKGLKPILALDLWEHAYETQYQNRADYVREWWKVVDWRKVDAMLSAWNDQQ